MLEENKERNQYRENVICRCKKENICIRKKCCCERCLPLKKNCNDECCMRIGDRCCNTENARCVPILSKRILDCVVLKKKQSSIIEDVVFTIDDDSREFDFSEPICIDKVGITYKFIGLNANEKSIVLVDSHPYVFNIPCEKIFSGCNSYLYDENNIAVTTGKYCCNEIDNDEALIKTRIIEKDLNFLICELKIFVQGRIGCKEFRAIKDYTEPERDCNCECSLITPPTFPISIKKLGFNAVTFVGRICLPQGAKKSTVHQKFDNCLLVECVTPKNKHICAECSLLCEGALTFKADVELSLLSNKLIYSTIREKLDILVDKNISKCGN